MAGLADRFIYFPTREHDGGTPRAIGLDYEDVRLRATDGTALHAWFVPGDPARPAVLFLHGNAGNISHRLEKLAVLHAAGAAVLLLDYRGYGQSEGEPDEAGLYRDADAAYDWLARPGDTPGPPVLYGESLGGAVAADLAARRVAAGLILDSTPSSIIDVARHHYPFIPMSFLMSARFDARAKIGLVRAPVLILHSPADEIVPFRMAEELYRAAREPKQLVRLAGGHNDNFVVAAAVYRRAVRDFLRRVRS